jgi:ketosteroid isomerase-like protein
MGVRITTLPLILVLAPACYAETVQRPPPPPANWQSLEARPRAAAEPGRIAATAKERAAAKLYLDAVASPGAAQLGKLLDEEAHFTFAGSGDAHGREKVVEAHEALFGTVDGRRFALRRILVTDSSQVLEWTLTGTHRATQKAIAIQGLTAIWTRDDGTITDVHLFFDQALIKAQLGEGPKGLEGLHPPSPAGSVQEVEQLQSAEERVDVDLVRAQLQALEDGREAAYLEAMADDVEVNTLERDAPLRGKAEAKSYFNFMRKAINYLATSIVNTWGVKSFVAVEYNILGEQRVPIGWIPVQRDPLMKMSVVEVIEIRDGKIARVWRYDNPSQIIDTP